MILIADAGSTKTQWCLMTANGQSSQFMTDGINPYFQTEDAIRQSIVNQLLVQMGHLMWAGTLTHVFFYGAGCTPQKSEVVKQVLESVFKKAKAEVWSDMLGAARAVLQRQSGVACILGTGSNSCWYDGEHIVWSVPALGYILGDEGSGAVLGKRLVADILKNQLSEELKEQFFSEFGTSQADVIENVYRRPFPNRYLASLSRFCANHTDHPLIQELLKDHFRQFIKRNVLQYIGLSNDNMPIGMVGSIAYYYRDFLVPVMQEAGLQEPVIMASPMEGLKMFHAQDLVPTQV